MCVHAPGHMQYVGMHAVVRRQPQALVLSTFHLFFAKRSILGLELRQVGYLAGQQASKIHLSFIHAFHVGSVDQNSYPHACMPSVSHTESFPGLAILSSAALPTQVPRMARQRDALSLPSWSSCL